MKNFLLICKCRIVQLALPAFCEILIVLVLALIPWQASRADSQVKANSLCIPSSDVVRQRSVALAMQGQGDQEAGDGNWEAALVCYQQARFNLMSLWSLDPDNPESFFQLALSLQKIAQVHYQLGSIKKASGIVVILQNLLAPRLARDEVDKNLNYLFAMTYKIQADILYQQGEHASAGQLYERANDIFRYRPRMKKSNSPSDWLGVERKPDWAELEIAWADALGIGFKSMYLYESALRILPKYVANKNNVVLEMKVIRTYLRFGDLRITLAGEFDHNNSHVKSAYSSARKAYVSGMEFAIGLLARPGRRELILPYLPEFGEKLLNLPEQEFDEVQRELLVKNFSNVLDIASKPMSASMTSQEMEKVAAALERINWTFEAAKLMGSSKYGNAVFEEKRGEFNLTKSRGRTAYQHFKEAAALWKKVADEYPFVANLRWREFKSLSKAGEISATSESIRYSAGLGNGGEIRQAMGDWETARLIALNVIAHPNREDEVKWLIGLSEVEFMMIRFGSKELLRRERDRMVHDLWKRLYELSLQGKLNAKQGAMLRELHANYPTAINPPRN